MQSLGGRSAIVRTLLISVIVLAIAAAGPAALLFNGGTSSASTDTSVATTQTLHAASASSTASGVVSAAVPDVASNIAVSTATTASSSQSTSQSASSSSGASNATVSQPSSSSTTSRPPAGLNITNMYADFTGEGDLAQITNSSSVADKSTFLGHPGETFLVSITIVYWDCSTGCPSQVTSVTASTPGFVISQVLPSTPITILAPENPSLGDLRAQLTVSVTAPSAPFNGTLTLIVNTQ